MDRQIDGLTDRWMDGWTDRWIGGQIYGWMGRYMDGWTDGCMARRIDRQIYGLMLTVAYALYYNKCISLFPFFSIQLLFL